MRNTVITLFALVTMALIILPGAAYADIPPWIKTNAGWWAEDSIPDNDFLAGISYLISQGVITVPPVTDASVDGNGDRGDPTADSTGSIPHWIKTNAGWWADGSISDDDFLNGIQYLIQAGLITVSAPDASMASVSADSDDPVLAELNAKLEECSAITKAYKRIDCEKPIKHDIIVHKYRTGASSFAVGPVTYYWPGLGSDGNNFEVSPSGQALLSLRMLAENTSDEMQSLDCTSPSLCSYDVWDGADSFRYAGTDFTSGQIVLRPGDAREFNILFGPNVGYGGSQFLYDASKTYHFRISESFGSSMIPLGLD